MLVGAQDVPLQFNHNLSIGDTSAAAHHAASSMDLSSDSVAQMSAFDRRFQDFSFASGAATSAASGQQSGLGLQSPPSGNTPRGSASAFAIGRLPMPAALVVPMADHAAAAAAAAASAQSPSTPPASPAQSSTADEDDDESIAQAEDEPGRASHVCSLIPVRSTAVRFPSCKDSHPAAQQCAWAVPHVNETDLIWMSKFRIPQECIDASCNHQYYAKFELQVWVFRPWCSVLC